MTINRDTYDYVRSLLRSTFNDFTGVLFPNDYIEPGVRREIDIIGKKLELGEATITTKAPHGILAGQAVVISNLGKAFDGEYRVTDVPSDVTFQYKRGGTLAQTAVAPTAFEITTYSAAGGVATFTTAAAHGLSVGNYVEIDMHGVQDSFNGTRKVTKVQSTTKFSVEVPDFTSIETVTLTNATLTIAGSPRVVEGVDTVILGPTSAMNTVTFRDPITFATSDAITAVANLNVNRPIVEKSLVAASNLARVTLDQPHLLAVGNTVVLGGAKDVAEVSSRRFPSNSTMVVRTKFPHNYKVGQSVTVKDSVDAYDIIGTAIASSVGTVTLNQSNNEVAVGNVVEVDSVVYNIAINSASITDGLVTLNLNSGHQFGPNTVITINGAVDVGTIINTQAFDGTAYLTLNRSHNFYEGQEIKVTGLGAPYNGKWTISATTETRIMFTLPTEVETRTIAPQRVSASVVSVNGGRINGEHVITSTTGTSVTFPIAGAYTQPSSAIANGVVSGLSILNGSRTVTARTATTVSFAMPGATNSAYKAVQKAAEGEPTAALLATGAANGTRTIASLPSPHEFLVARANNSTPKMAASGTVSAISVFNGTRTVTAIPDADTFEFTLSGQKSNILETANHDSGYAVVVVGPKVGNTATAISGNQAIFMTTYTGGGATGTQMNYSSYANRGTGSMRPVAIVSSFGPFPSNSDIGIRYNMGTYSGVNVEPTLHRGFELATVGEVLDKYSDTIDGFEYRIDCAFDVTANKFVKTFVMVPINKPNPPAPGEVSPLSRFGADKLVFEYPGNIVTLTLDETAEEAVTRMFVSGENDLGPDAGPPIGIATATDLLSGEGVVGRKWPLLDDVETQAGVEEETTLHSYATKYLSESRPPDSKFELSVNGSLQPIVGSYNPGDWCSIIVDDEFLRRRLATDLEPRDDVIVRKIDAIKVKVPDGVTFPETVTLVLVPEWEVDTRG